MDRSELLEEVLIRPRDAHVECPGVRKIRRPDWHQQIAPALKEGGLNTVSLARIDDSQVDQVIDDTIREYEELGVQYRWTVGPDSRPLDLGARLEARGLRPITAACMAMGAQPLPGPPAFEIEEVGLSTLDEFNALMAEGWGNTSTAMSDYNAHVLRSAPEQSPFFLARHEGKAVGGASYFAFERSAYLMGGVVLPAFRGRGVYRALVEARRAHAKERGIDLVTCHAIAETSAPALDAMGFDTLLHIVSYVSW